MDIYPQTIPYTYLIGWSQHNKWYYGVQFRKNCNPKDLWIKYFTSSKRVKLFREIYGEPDIVQIRKIFDTAEKALIWEEKVLKRLKVIYDDKWLNMAYTSGRFHTKNKIFITNNIHQCMIDKDMNIPEGWRYGKSDKVRQNYKKGASKRTWYFSENAHKKSIEIRKNSILITDDIVNIFHPKNQPIPIGFRIGMSKDLCKKRSETRIGKKHTAERKKNIGNSKRGYRFITNGMVEIQIKDSILPEGFTWGRLPRTKEHNKNAGNARKGLKWYNNGQKDILCNPKNVPEGFTPGRISIKTK